MARAAHLDGGGHGIDGALILCACITKDRKLLNKQRYDGKRREGHGSSHRGKKKVSEAVSSWHLDAMRLVLTRTIKETEFVAVCTWLAVFTFVAYNTSRSRR
jgi:hypothetical protein